MKAPPSKDLCLMMAKVEHQRMIKSKYLNHREEIMWEWLIAWGFYEAFIDGWYEGVKL